MIGFGPTRRMLSALVVVLVGVVLCSCGSGGEGGLADTTTAGSSTVDATPGVDSAAYKLTVSGAETRSSSQVSVTATSQPAPSLPDFLVSTAPGVEVSLGDGAQPSAPLTLSFDFSGKPAPQSTYTVVPAVVAVAEGSVEPEVLRSHWDPSSQTLTVQTGHLSSFFPISVDFTALGDQFTGVVNGFIGLAQRQTDCVGKPLTIDDTTYTMNPPSVAAAWPCLSASADRISVDLSSNSPNGWVVRSAPATPDMSVDLKPDTGNLVNQVAYRSIFARPVGNGTFLLPGGTTHLRFAKTDPPRQVTLRADPGVTLLNGLAVGLNALFPGAKLLDIPGMVDCLKPVAPNFGDPDPTGAAIGNDTKTLINCVTSVTNSLWTKPKPGTWFPASTTASKSLGAVLSLGPNIANQLAATLRGFVGEFTGDNTQTIIINAEREEVAPSAQPTGQATLNLITKITSDGAGTEIGPNHFQISKRYHDRGAYYADVNYKWTINRPPGSDLGYCKGHVTVINSSGAVIDQFDDDGFNQCRGGGAFSTNLKLYTPGTYTVTATIEMERGPTLHGSQQFILDP